MKVVLVVLILLLVVIRMNRQRIQSFHETMDALGGPVPLWRKKK